MAASLVRFRSVRCPDMSPNSTPVVEIETGEHILGRKDSSASGLFRPVRSRYLTMLGGPLHKYGTAPKAR